MNNSKACWHSCVIMTAIFGFTSMTSCTDLLTKELDIEEDLGYTSKLGLSGTLRNDYSDSTSLPITYLLLAENQSILDTNTSPNYYNSDNVDLYKDGSYFNTFTSSGQGIHRNQLMDSLPPAFTLESGSYRVEVDHPEFGLVSAEAEMPEPVFLNFIELKESDYTIVELGNQKRYEVTFQFYDPPGSHYYEVDLVTDNTSNIDTIFNETDTTTIQRVVYAFIESITIPNAIEIDNGVFRFDDSTFDASFNRFTFSMISNTKLYNTSIEELAAITSLKFSSLSEDQYNFETSYQEYQDNQILGPFSEPVSLYSNVENGLGYLGAVNFYYAPFSD